MIEGIVPIMMGSSILPGNSFKIVATSCLVLTRIIGNTKRKEALMKQDYYANRKVAI